MRSIGAPAFRAKQVQEWVCKRFTTEPSAMNNLPTPLRAQLAEGFRCSTAKPLGTIGSADGTRKVLLGLTDGNTVEAVMIPGGPDRMTFC